VTDEYYAITVAPAVAGADGEARSRVLHAGEFDISVRDELSLTLVAAVGDGAHVVVDMRRVRFIDSEAISAVIDGYRAADLAGVEFQVSGAGGVVKRVFEISGLGHLLVT
jgi:anti-sigma B factor antagonist